MLDLSKLYPKEPGTMLAVYEHVRQKIVSWAFAPGERLSEQKISDELGISRTPVREAFIRLASEGLLEARPYRGTFVTLINVSQIDEVRFIRSCLESEVAQLACTLPLPGFIEYAEENIRQQRSALASGDLETFNILDDSLHERLFAACDKRLSWQMIQMMSGQYQRVRHALMREALPDEHQAIIDAIKAKDAPAARRIMQSHLGLIEDELSAMQAEHPEFFRERGTQDGEA